MVRHEQTLFERGAYRPTDRGIAMFFGGYSRPFPGRVRFQFDNDGAPRRIVCVGDDRARGIPFQPSGPGAVFTAFQGLGARATSGAAQNTGFSA